MRFNTRTKLLIGLILVVITWIIISPFFASESNPASNFKGNSESFSFIGQNSQVQFNAKQIFTHAQGIEFYSVNNITVENSNGETRLINYTTDIHFLFHEGAYQPLSNVEVDMVFDNLTLKKGFQHRINLSGKLAVYPHSLKSNGGEVVIDTRKWALSHVIIGDEEITNYKQISFELNKNNLFGNGNTSMVSFYPEETDLIATGVSDLKIRSQLSKIELSQSDGILRLGDHTFDIKGSDILDTEILPAYQNSSFLSVEDTKMSFNGLTNSTILNNKDISLSDIPFWFEWQPEKINAYSSAINAIVAVLLVILTAFNVRSTNKLVSMEAEKKKHEMQKFLNILLAEFEENKILLSDLKKSVASIIKDRANLYKFEFLGFKEDGFNSFRNQGGFEYISTELYTKIVEYYSSLYRISKKFDMSSEKKTGLLLLIIRDEEPMKDIEALESYNDAIRKELASEILKLKNIRNNGFVG